MDDLSLRLARPGDAGAIAAIYAPYVAEGTASFELKPPSEAEMARRMEQGRGLFPWLVALAGEEVTGYAYAGRLGERPGYDWSAAVTVYIDEKRRQAGAGRKLYTALLGLLAAQGYRCAFGIVASPNPASERFHEAMGFMRQGLLENCGYKFGKPLGVCYYARALLPVTENPPPPRRLDALSPLELVAWLG